MDGRFPEKLFYRIGDVTEISGIKPHVLRYWEEEFSSLRPRKNRAGQRIYEQRDVELVLEIKMLLYDQRYTIPGARKLLARRAKQSHKPSPPAMATGEISAALKTCCQDLRALLTLMDQKEGRATESRRKEADRSHGSARRRKAENRTGGNGGGA